MQHFHVLLALGMLITGSINTITTKAADIAYTTDRYGKSVQFNHPFFQALCMFVGESLCLIVYYISKWRTQRSGKSFDSGKSGFNPFILVLPAMCDLTATSLMYLGLSMTDASIFQMLRGSVVVFTSLFSVIFLKRKLRAYHWIGIVLVMGGTAIVGAQGKICVASSSSGPSENSNAMLGNILIIAAQLIVATQMVVEEKFIGSYDLPPLRVVGLEGTFGFCMLAMLLVVMYYVPSPGFLCTGADQDCSRFEDSYDALVNMKNSWQVSLALLGNTCSIAFFNYFGVSVTRHINASTRMVLDSMRTMIIWGVSLALKWETFCWVEILGFVVLLSGTLIYNAIIPLPGMVYESEEAEPAAGKAGGLLSDVDGYDVDDGELSM